MPDVSRSRCSCKSSQRKVRTVLGSEKATLPNRVPAERGTTVVQIQRTTHSGRYADGRATPEGAPYKIESGERSNFEQYRTAILAARRSIYIENQQIDVPEIVNCLHRALTRGVDVILLVPFDPDVASQTQLERRAVLKPLIDFGIFENFMLAGIAGVGADGRRKSIYVHSKLMLVDDEWATAGSCNLHRFSLFGNGEMNAANSLRNPPPSGHPRPIARLLRSSAVQNCDVRPPRMGPQALGKRHDCVLHPGG